MGFNAVLTPDDLKKGDLVDPGWYPCEIVNYEESEVKNPEAKNPGSLNCTFHFKVLDGKFKGVQFNRLFNETALGFGKNMYAALKLPKTPDGGYQLNSSIFQGLVGRKLKVYVKRSKSNKGNDFNDVQDFAELTQ